MKCVLVAALAVLGTGCETKMAPLDLSAAGINATVSAPEGATVAKERGAVTIKNGKTFELEIRPRAADLNVAKSDCTNAKYKNCEIVLEQADALLTKWVQMSKDVHRISANVQVGGTTYSCDSSSGAGVKVSKSDAELMLKTCKSLTPKT